MALYTFYNQETDEFFEDLLSFADKDEFLKQNPHIKQIIEAPNIVSGVSTSKSSQIDGGFRDVLNRIGNANPYSPLGERYGDKGIRESKNRWAVDRQRKRQESIT